MRFVPVKRHDQLEVQALHRVREHLIVQRTAVINQCRSFLLEYGIAIRVGAGVFKHDFPHILSDDTNELTPAMRQLLTDLWSDFSQLELRITSLSRQIESTANRDDAARRLMSIPGIGPLGASAMCAAIGDGKQFKHGRDLAAWIGLATRQYSTGGKPTLLGISKSV
jgi:transposase